MPHFLLVAVVFTASPGSGQVFECRMGQDAACLDWGETVCSNQGMCVDKNSACFDTYQCDYKGFACKSAVDECVKAHDSIVEDYNTLLADYETLRTEGGKLAESHEKLQLELMELKYCLAYASTFEEAQFCAN